MNKGLLSKLAASGHGYHVESLISLAARRAASQENCIPINTHTMAPCNDRPYHTPVPPGVVHPLLCPPNPLQRAPCAQPHDGYAGGFTVCDGCMVHTSRMLLLAPHLHPLPRNRARLSNGHFWMLHPATGVPIPWPQTGVSPPEPPVFGPGALVANWRTPAERATGKVRAANHTNPPWDGFLTRVCQDCESKIQSEVIHRNANLMTPAPNWQEWEENPWISCTCKATLGIHPTRPPATRYCLRHRRAVWNELVRTKNRNDRWLRNIEFDKKTQQIVPASKATKARRVRHPNPGYYRACRVSQSVFRWL